jgi:TatD DNase family protein
MIIDTHCHLDDARYDDDLETVLKRAKAEGVRRFVIPGADPATLQKAVRIAETYEDVYFAAGVHPYDAQHYDASFLESFLKHEKCVAVGECGLDYYRLPEDEEQKRANKRLQREVFVDQLALAQKYDKPVIVHIREASADSLEILQKNAPSKGGVLHCYNASPILLELAETFYYGIGGVLTFKNAKKLVEIYPHIPQNRLVIETDAPYLTPHPYRGKRNEPAYCVYVAEKMAELSGTTREEIAQMTTDNANRLFGW